MSNWYKMAALSNDITSVIVAWLRHARNGLDSASANDDISHQMQGADNQAVLMGAINTASAIVMREQGGMLTPTQQELVQIINNRTQDFEQVQDPFQMPQMGEVNQDFGLQPVQDLVQNNG